MKKLKLILAGLFILVAANAHALGFVQGYAERGGRKVLGSPLGTTVMVQGSYPSATITVYVTGTSTLATIYSDTILTPKINPFSADPTGYFSFYTNEVFADIKTSGAGLPAPFTRTFATQPVIGAYITSADGDARYLRLIGGNLAGPGNLTVGGSFVGSGGGSFAGQLTTTGGLFDLGGIVTRGSLLSINPTGAGASAQTQYAATGYDWRVGGQGSGSVAFTIRDTQNAVDRLTIASPGGLTTLSAGLTVSGGTTTVGALNAGATTATSVASAGAVSGTTGTFSAVSGTTGTFAGAVSGTSGTFTSLNDSGAATITGNLGVGGGPGSANITAGVGGANNGVVQATSGNAANYSQFLTSGLSGSGYLAFVSGANVLVTGDQAGDMDIVTSGPGINFNAGGTLVRTGRLSATGFVVNGTGATAGSAVFPLHGKSTTSPQVVAEYDTTHRTGIGHDGTNGLMGTTTNQPLRIQTNATDRIFIDTAGNTGIGATTTDKLHVTGGNVVLDTTQGFGWGTLNEKITADTASGQISFFTAGTSKITLGSGGIFNIGTGTLGVADASGAYPVSFKKNGTSCAGANATCVVSVFNGAGSLGLLLGYDTNNAGAVIGPNTNSAPIDFWVKDGAGTWQLPLTLTGAIAAVGLPLELTSNISKVNNTVTAGSTGVAVVRGSVNLSAQGASIGATNIYNPGGGSPPVRVCWDQIITRAATTSSSIQTTILWNNGAAKTSTYWVDAAAGTTGTAADASNTLGSERGNCFMAMSGSAIQYSTTYATSGATSMQYALKIVVEQLQ